MTDRPPFVEARLASAETQLAARADRARGCCL